ncbi:MAG TPA: C39 family peptidase, partial [Myxococcales bacterium]|nr:C39 family peptidase [Myxococcales bacterium]
MADAVIKPDDTVRTAADLKAPDLEGLEGRWLDVPRLQQRSTEVRSNYWCGRASAAMVYAYYCKAAKKDAEYIGHTDGDKGPGTNGGVYNLRFLGGAHKGELAGVTKTGLCHPQGVFETAGWKSDSGELASSQDVSTDEPEVVKRFARHIDQLKKNNPIVQFTQLTKNRGHIVVINGYKKSSDRGELWLRIVDPCYPHEDLLGAGNYQMITRPVKPDHELSEYWLKARRLLEVYPGRKTRIFAHGDAPLGHFFYAIPTEPVKDDNELVHKIGKGLGDAAAPAAGADSKAADSKGAAASAPAAACPPLTGVPRLPFPIGKSSLVT